MAICSLLLLLAFYLSVYVLPASSCCVLSCLMTVYLNNQSLVPLGIIHFQMQLFLGFCCFMVWLDFFKQSCYIAQASIELCVIKAELKSFCLGLLTAGINKHASPYLVLRPSWLNWLSLLCPACQGPCKFLISWQFGWAFSIPQRQEAHLYIWQAPDTLELWHGLSQVTPHCAILCKPYCRPLVMTIR